MAGHPLPPPTKHDALMTYDIYGITLQNLTCLSFMGLYTSHHRAVIMSTVWWFGLVVMMTGTV